MLTIRQVNEMRRLYAAGHKRSALAALYNTSYFTVYSHTKPTPEERAAREAAPRRNAVLRGIKAGLRLEQIAEQLGITRETARVQMWKLRRLGELPPLETPASPPEPVAPAADRVRPPRRSAAGASKQPTTAA